MKFCRRFSSRSRTAACVGHSSTVNLNELEFTALKRPTFDILAFTQMCHINLRSVDLIHASLQSHQKV